MNLQRALDHGLSSYNQARLAFGLSGFNNFDQLTRNQRVNEKFRFIYNNKPENMELFDAIIAEDPMDGGVLG